MSKVLKLIKIQFVYRKKVQFRAEHDLLHFWFKTTEFEQTHNTLKWKDKIIQKKQKKELTSAIPKENPHASMENCTYDVLQSFLPNKIITYGYILLCNNIELFYSLEKAKLISSSMGLGIKTC